MSTSSRRYFLQNAGLGLGGLALHYLAARAQAGPLTPKNPPLPATAKNVIFLFMHGGR
jgi:hypothetical protein